MMDNWYTGNFKTGKSLRGKGNYKEKSEVQARGKGNHYVNSMKIVYSDTHRPDTMRCASD
jgi:hypothetical protein